MRPLPNYPSTDNNQVCLLKRSLYGLRQASKQWNEKLTASLVEFGFVRSKANYILFPQALATVFASLLIYVDNIVLMSSNVFSGVEVKDFLATKCRIKTLKWLKYFLDMKVAFSRKGIQICQQKLVLDLLAETGCLASKPFDVPMDPDTKLNREEDKLFHDLILYRRLIGKLLYLTNTRLDLIYSVNLVSQFMEAPREPHFHVITKILRYTKGALGQ